MKIFADVFARSLMNGLADLALAENPITREHVQPVIDRFAKENFPETEIEITAERLAEGVGLLKRRPARGGRGPRANDVRPIAPRVSRRR